MYSGAVIFQLLAASSGLTTLVPSTKIFAVRVQQPTTIPYIVYREIARVPLNTKGDSTDVNANPREKQRSILDTSTVSISVFTNRYDKAESIAVEIRNALDRYHTSPSGLSNIISVDSIVFESAVDDFDEDYGDSGCYIKHLDFTIRINRILTNR